MSGLRNIARTGPSNGSNAMFRFGLEKLPLVSAPGGLPQPFSRPDTHDAVPELPSSIILISCVKSKLPHKAAARDLYTSPRFRMSRDIADGNGSRWYVLSSLYGLLGPQDVVETYDYTLNELDIATRRVWAQKVFDALIRAEPNLRRVTMFAGKRYREFLAPKLNALGVEVHVPMEHLRQGEQLAWLAERT